MVQAAGVDAAQALAAVEALAADHFGERDEEEVWQPQTETAVSSVDEGQVTGVPASPGVAVGAVAHYRPVVPEIVPRQVEDVEKEWRMWRKSGGGWKRPLSRFSRLHRG